MFYDRAETADETPNNLLLFGDASFDYKNKLYGATNFVPTYESFISNSIESSYCTDDYFGVLDDAEGVALRGLFIIDPDGVIMHSTINNLPVGRNVDETLRVLQAFQYVQANPDEVCPANWTPGEKTMKPDPEGSKEYFSAIS